MPTKTSLKYLLNIKVGVFVKYMRIVGVFVNWVGFGSRLSKRQSLKRPPDNKSWLRVVKWGGNIKE